MTFSHAWRPDISRRFFRLGPALLLGVALAAFPAAGRAQTTKGGSTMSGSHVEPVDAGVAAALAKYDATRDLASLQAAGDVASLHDGEYVTDPAAAQARGLQRLADWVAILTRFKRDIDPDFNPDKPPSMRITPPGPEGLQYMAGVDPKDVEDPVLREKYIAAMKHNQEVIANFGFLSKLAQLHRVLLEKAVASVKDAHEALGMTTQEIVAALEPADIQPADKARLLAAAG
jgi:hypothetical protein